MRILQRWLFCVLVAGGFAKGTCAQESAPGWTLIVCVMEGCPWCEKFVPVVLQVGEKLGLKVLPIADEGGLIVAGLPVHENEAVFDLLNPDGFAPLLFLVKEEGTRILPVCQGMETMANVEATVSALLKSEGSA